jgi:hypothetical protein
MYIELWKLVVMLVAACVAGFAAAYDMSLNEIEELKDQLGAMPMPGPSEKEISKRMVGMLYDHK